MVSHYYHWQGLGSIVFNDLVPNHEKQDFGSLEHFHSLAITY